MAPPLILTSMKSPIPFLLPVFAAIAALSTPAFAQ